jgi:hydrophobe/amphiphile efflux-1 (HAE1) family protein
MSLPAIAIRRPVFAWMLMAGIVIFGAISFHRLGVSQLPDVDFPVVSVSFTLNGAAPEVMESQVLDPVEDAIMEIDGIRSVTSSAQQSSASISVEFELTQNIDEAMEEIQNKVNQVKNLMPLNLFPPTLRKTNPEDQPILWLVLTSDDPKTKKLDLLIYARNDLYDQFSVAPGVGNIALGGYIDPALRVWLDLNKLEKYELTADDVKASILSEQKETEAGVINGPLKEYNMRVMGETASPEEFGKIRIQSRASLGPNYRPTALNQVATIEEGTADVRRLARYNGKDAIGLGIIKQHGSNAVDVAEMIRKQVKEIQPLLPPHYHLDVRNDKTRFIKTSVDGLIFTLIVSALLTSLVCFLFLGSWTSTVNILLSIPTSILGSFIAFYFCGFTLNTFTLLGLSLAIGIVVDDSIMMLENIVRHREMGMGKKLAALVGAEEISFAAIAATIAVVAIFLPVVFMKGIIGRYFLQYGVTVTVAVLLSLLEALTLTPMRCSRFLRVDHDPKGLAAFVNRVFAAINVRYAKILTVLLRNRWKTVLVAVVFFIGSCFVSKLLPGELMPPQDQSQLMLRFKLPVGTSINVTDEKIAEVEKYLLSTPEVEGVFSAVGGFGGDAVNQGMAFVTLVDPSKRKFTQAEMGNRFREAIRKKVKGMTTIVQDLSLRGFAATRGFPVEFIIQGPNWQTLDKVTTEVMDALRKSKYVVDVNTDIQQNMPETQIIPDRAKMAAHGVSLSTVTNQLNELVGGEVIYNSTAYPKGKHRYEIEMRLIDKQRDKIPDLNRIKLRNNRGEVTRLSDVVTETHVPSLMLISRLNRSRAITVYANPAPGVSQAEAMKETEIIAKKVLPQGYYMKNIGSSQSFKESFTSLMWAMALGILVSYMVLASQFDSFLHPVTVLMALPFSFTGAFIALWIGHQSINMYSLIGFILLMGIVKKNSILLVDYTNQCRREGMSVDEALIKACPVRLRPIVMTSAATVAAAFPEALHIAPGSETTMPMATAIIGGVIASTVLTLFVVPVVYSLFSRFEKIDPLAQEEIDANKAARLAAAAQVAGGARV